MFIHKASKFIFFIFKRGIIFYLLIWILWCSLIDFNKMLLPVKFLVLNRIRPDDILVEKNKAFDMKILEAHAFYYKKVAEYVPLRADAFGILGFCLYHLDKKNESKQAYKNAININPDFFWFHYNLGLLYFKDKQFKESADSLKKALAADPNDVFEQIRISKRIYLPLLSQRSDNSGEFIKMELKNGYQKAYILLNLSQFYMTHPKDKGQIPDNLKYISLLEMDKLELEVY